MENRPHSRLQSTTRLDPIIKMLRENKIAYIGRVVETPPFSPLEKPIQRLPVNEPFGQIATSSIRPSRRKGMDSPRSLCSHHRPASIAIQQSNGCTAISTAELKQTICDSRNDSQLTITQVPIDRRESLPPTPTTPFYWAIMGNNPSSVAGGPLLDGQPLNPVSRSDKAVSRKSSFNVFKRVDSRSPLSRDVTSSVMSVIHQDSLGRNAAAGQTGHDYDDDVNEAVTVVADPIFNRAGSAGNRFSRASHVHTASATTMTEDKARRPLSASTTIRDFRLLGHGRGNVSEPIRDENARWSKPSLHNASLSPTLPAPSPLPEDSPHKYGLRDRMVTPELPNKAIVIPKARRKSSGLEVFNEAKSLQSAASFLNGLSTSRRRAESAADTSISSWVALTTPLRPSATRASSSRPSSRFQEGVGRRNGHNFKSSGFAYSRPLNVTQIKCFRGHSRMLLSRNKHAPVECAVCHIDDEGEHFSCSWCAIRMCKYCRKDFAQRGMGALRERIKTAELGSSSENSSSESLVHRGRRLSSRSFTHIA